MGPSSRFQLCQAFLCSAEGLAWVLTGSAWLSFLSVQVSTYHPAPASPGHSPAIASLPGSQQHLSANM